ncbi:THC0290_0291 family protein [Algibacter mikhailovii]|uniref:Glutamate dehydrogenase n=1 Tax=Algibacter mikhailovii TaxID=425498 RepID=A0A918V8C7_9FLAO|nr:glutamate dehydrogenase [Algibacter mikhailovii]GGZ75201.1 glutamate dehydrogenase [Algibacter mikhailovii]
MLKLKNLVLSFCLLLLTQISQAQLGLYHELGVIAGPVQFRSDFGARDDSSTNFGNTGFGVGVVHYLNFTYTDEHKHTFTNTYFNDHFKVRSELSYNTTKLEHHGQWADPSRTNENAKKLRGHKGSANNFDIGAQLEYSPLSLGEFQSYGHKFSPYLTLGAHYTFSSAKVSTDYQNPDPSAIGDVTDPSNFYSFWEPGSVDVSNSNSWSVVSSVGVSYKLTRMSDLILDLRWQYYFSDWVDGLNHQLPGNESNDWLMWLSVGYVHYLD